MVSEKSGMVFLLNGKIFSIWAIITSNYHSCTLEPPWGDRKLTDWLPKTMIFDPYGPPKSIFCHIPAFMRK